MKKFFNILKETIFWIWQAPQNLLGLFMLGYYQHEEEYLELNGRRFYFTTEIPSGISLGNYIIMNREDREDGMKHEYGHTIQSRILGPLYLLIIGLPSGTYNIIDRLIVEPKLGRERSYEIYYNMPWEHWADKLGGVKRFGFSS